eukprot:2441962-Pleurochrysis_carterae.AAC.3
MTAAVCPTSAFFRLCFARPWPLCAFLGRLPLSPARYAAGAISPDPAARVHPSAIFAPHQTRAHRTCAALLLCHSCHGRNSDAPGDCPRRAEWPRPRSEAARGAPTDHPIQKSALGGCLCSSQSCRVRAHPHSATVHVAFARPASKSSGRRWECRQTSLIPCPLRAGARGGVRARSRRGSSPRPPQPVASALRRCISRNGSASSHACVRAQARELEEAAAAAREAEEQQRRLAEQAAALALCQRPLSAARATAGERAFGSAVSQRYSGVLTRVAAECRSLQTVKCHCGACHAHVGAFAHSLSCFCCSCCCEGGRGAIGRGGCRGCRTASSRSHRQGQHAS